MFFANLFSIAFRFITKSMRDIITDSIEWRRRKYHTQILTVWNQICFVRIKLNQILTQKIILQTFCVKLLNLCAQKSCNIIKVIQKMIHLAFAIANPKKVHENEQQKKILKLLYFLLMEDYEIVSKNRVWNNESIKSQNEIFPYMFIITWARRKLHEQVRGGGGEDDQVWH